MTAPLAPGFDSLEVIRMDTDKYRIVMSGQGLSIDALLVGKAAEAIATALQQSRDPRALLAEYRAKTGGSRR